MTDVKHHDLRRQLVVWLAEVAAESPGPPLRHDGPCGRRAACPRGHSPAYPSLELLRNGDLLAHCHRVRLRRGDPGAAELFEAFDE